MTELLKVEGVSTGYMHREIVHNAALSVAPGEFCALLGLNGCGKTTLMKAICGLEQAPIFCPMLEKMGVDPVHLGVIMVVNLAIGFITPPLGVNLFVACNVANTTLGKICKAIVPIIIVMVVDLMIITYIEPTVMLLPNLIY